MASRKEPKKQKDKISHALIKAGFQLSEETPVTDLIHQLLEAHVTPELNRFRSIFNTSSG